MVGRTDDVNRRQQCARRPHQPWGNITSLLHYSTEGKPEAIEDRKVVREGRPVDAVLDLPLVRAEAADDEQDDADADVGEDHVQPDLVRERVHEREDAWLLFLRLLDHDADAEAHERLREVDQSLARRRRRQRRDGKVGLLQGQGRRLGQGQGRNQRRTQSQPHGERLVKVNVKVVKTETKVKLKVKYKES